MIIRVDKATVQGNITVVSSKSLIHRYIILASLIDKKLIIKNVDLSDDILRTIEAFKTVGKTIEYDEYDKFLTIYGSINYKKNYEIFVGESGSTLRFLMPLFLHLFKKVVFTGKKSLFNRPLESYYKIFDENHIRYVKTEYSISLEGDFNQNYYSLEGNISSQFLTGLLLTFINFKEKKTIIIKNELESKNYIDLTISCLKKFQIEIENKNYEVFEVWEFLDKKFNLMNPIYVESDFSQAAFFLVLGAINNQVTISNLHYHKSIQGDKKIIDYLKLVKAKIEVFDDKITVSKSRLKKGRFDLKNCPDLGPILFVLALFCEGNSLFYNVKRLRYKESDRIKAMLLNFEKIGVKFIEKENFVLIKRFDFNKVFDELIEFNAFNDHRIAISMAILSSTLYGKFLINGFESINKSYPRFIEDFKKLGGTLIEQ